MAARISVWVRTNITSAWKSFGGQVVGIRSMWKPFRGQSPRSIWKSFGGERMIPGSVLKGLGSQRRCLLRIWEAYGRLVVKYPWGSQIAQTAVLLSAGDVISQLLVERRSWKTFELERVCRFFVQGCIFAPILRIWYITLDKIIKTSGTSAVVKKVFLDQIVYAPPYLIFFVVVTGILQRLSMEEIVWKLRSEMPDIMWSNYQLWPATQFVNFFLVPLHHRVLVINVVGLFWNTYMAFKTNQDDSFKDNGEQTQSSPA